MSKPEESDEARFMRLAAEGEALIRLNDTDPMADGFVGIHTMYTMLQTAGFTRTESLWLVGYISLGGNIRIHNDEED